MTELWPPKVGDHVAWTEDLHIISGSRLPIACRGIVTNVLDKGVELSVYSPAYSTNMKVTRTFDSIDRVVQRSDDSHFSFVVEVKADSKGEAIDIIERLKQEGSIQTWRTSD